MSKTIRGLLVKEDKEPEVIEFPNNLKSLQNLVGGYIEYCYLPEYEDVVIICNEEGKINGMGPNRDIGHDIIFGPFLVVGDNPDIGENLSLTEEQISEWTKRFDKSSIERTYEKMTKIKLGIHQDFEL